LLTFCLIVIALYSGTFGAWAEEQLPSEDPVLTTTHGSLDFNGCLRIALETSPYFTSSSLEIAVKRLDESDSRYGMFPTLSFRTRYFVNAPQDVLNRNSQPYSLGFYADSYNPFESYFSLQARKIVTKIAIYGHLLVITKAIHRLGGLFLELDSQRRMAVFQDDLIAKNQQNTAYAQNRLKSESASALDLRAAEQELEMARLEKDKITSAQAALMDEIKTLIGLKAQDDLDLDMGGIRQQVLDAFDPIAATFEEARTNSYELKIQGLRKELQELNVNLAYARFLPTLIMGVETGDPLNIGNRGAFYTYFGAEMPIWDGLKRARDVKRQKTVLNQYNAEEKTKELDLNTAWSNARRKVTEAAADLKLARTREEIGSLKKKQNEISYREGRESLAQYLDECKKAIDVQKNSELKELEYFKAVLDLYALSGELSRRFVKPDSF
jgi:outer membrane protein TolC